MRIANVEPDPAAALAGIIGRPDRFYAAIAEIMVDLGRDVARKNTELFWH